MLAKSSKAYKNISEASEELGLEAHVLRFWESRFDNLKPMTRGGKRRFYSPEDMELLQKIKYLLHEEGHTIKAANRMLEIASKSSSKKQLPKLVTKPVMNLSQISIILDKLIINARKDIARMNAILA